MHTLLLPRLTENQTNSDRNLIDSIRRRWGATIVWACSTTSIPPAFVAALIANESGGDPDATNLETSILKIFRGIRAGTHRAWGIISESYLRGKSDGELIKLATSYGLTQITGYNVLPAEPAKLLEPEFNLLNAVRMLRSFATHYRIDPETQAEQLFRCWNTGHPHGIPAASSYVPSGLARIELYKQLAPPAGGNTAHPAEPSPAAPLSTEVLG